jgi:hypothetical protein
MTIFLLVYREAGKLSTECVKIDNEIPIDRVFLCKSFKAKTTDRQSLFAETVGGEGFEPPKANAN